MRGRLAGSALLLTFAASTAHAAVIYEQLPGSSSNFNRTSSTLNYLGGSPGFTTADDFTLAIGASITGVNWWGRPGVPGGDDFRFTFYADGGGAPGAILHTTGGTLSKTLDGVEGIHNFFYSSELTVPFIAAAGTTLWLSVFNQAPDAGWAWARAQLAGNGSLQGLNPGPPWPSLRNPDMAFQLTSVPEPSILGLLVAGVLGARLRRRANRGRPRVSRFQSGRY